MGGAVEALLAYRNANDCYSVPFEKVRDLQVAAMDERLQERVARIPLLALRAREAGADRIASLADVVPFLLPHTAYKSYPESFLADSKWDKLTRWLGTVSAYPIENVDLNGIADVDDWLNRLEAAGYHVSCSSGTTGKAAMLIASPRDSEWAVEDTARAFSWGSGVKPENDRLIFGLAPVPKSPRNIACGRAFPEYFGIPGREPFAYPVPPITIGSITRMIVLRKAIAEGTARPDEIAEYEATSLERQNAVEAAAGICADALIEARAEKLYLSGFWAGMYAVAQEVRARGYGAKDFHQDNTIYVGGGLKGAQLPSDYREFVYETFNISPDRNFAMYGMQEIGSALPRCQKGGRYHVPPWVVCVPLNKAGDALVPITDGEIECRAAFFDLSLDGRWGGVISGDRIHLDYGPCECGAATPSIRDDVIRYSDIQGDDKIACSGTVDAYVRGLS